MTRSKPSVFRFAPSPNGRLHLGHVRSALLNAKRAQAGGGVLLLRMEDIDRDRCRPEYETAICEDLAWLGITWATPVLRQSEHFPRYRAILQGLVARRLLYPCFCSRQDVSRAVAGRSDWPCDPDGVRHYPGTCRLLSARQRAEQMAAGTPFSWRLDMASALAAVDRSLAFMELGPRGSGKHLVAEPQVWGDVILGRKDIPASYHLAVVADDALQGVTDVVRGDDLFYATYLHRLLQAVLDLPVPTYCHHSLLLDSQGRKLAKSSGAKPVAEWRREGFSAADISAMALLGVVADDLGTIAHKMASFP